MLYSVPNKNAFATRLIIWPRHYSRRAFRFLSGMPGKKWETIILIAKSLLEALSVIKYPICLLSLNSSMTLIIISA